jgi:hypothetical protein
MDWGPTINAQTIEGFLRYRKSMTAEQIAETLCGEPGRKSDVLKDLDWLYESKRIGRDSNGYYPCKHGPSSLNANDHRRDWISGVKRP